MTDGDSVGHILEYIGILRRDIGVILGTCSGPMKGGDFHASGWISYPFTSLGVPNGCILLYRC